MRVKILGLLLLLAAALVGCGPKELPEPPKDEGPAAAPTAESEMGTAKEEDKASRGVHGGE